MSLVQSFEEFYCQNSRIDKNGNERDMGKERAKYAEVVEAVGISSRLLKQACEDADANQTGKTRWAIPQASTEFVMWLLDEYTSRDFKELRRANWYGVSLDTTNKLMDGFCSMLLNLGYDPNVINEQRLLMARRLHYALRSQRSEVDTAIGELSAKLEEYEHSFRMNKSDLAYFYGFVKTQISNLTRYIDEVYEDFIDVRNDELSDQAFEEAGSLDIEETMLRINQDCELQEALENDPEYAKLSKKAQQLIDSDDFVKSIKGQYDRIINQMEQIRHCHERRLFGAELPQEEISPLRVRHPSIVLREAIQDVEDVRESRKRWEEEQAKITPEQREQMRKCYERICQEQGWEPYPHTLSTEENPKGETDS